MKKNIAKVGPRILFLHPPGKKPRRLGFPSRYWVGEVVAVVYGKGEGHHGHGRINE